MVETQLVEAHQVEAHQVEVHQVETHQVETPQKVLEAQQAEKLDQVAIQPKPVVIV